ncbi:hypothetical protein GCM10007962_20250 [Yeosuana aromativorans]|uniref:EF-hand domain-containing protein n=2 Tax=Yeosuana aromativorans TaxID=288019 RepID=A0A8J3FGS2_9FLAO|nr:hypothetical protein GCM10007962_20250 [Yeosuana aromativorans]
MHRINNLKQYPMKFNSLTIVILALGLIGFTQANAQNKKPDPQKMFNSIDTNKDGSISLEEFKAKKRKQEVKPEVLEKRYAHMDADNNGSVTLEEFKAGLAKGKGMKDKKKKEK